MTQDERQQFEEMKRQIERLVQFMEDKKRQQISFPLDEVSKEIIRKI